MSPCTLVMPLPHRFTIAHASIQCRFRCRNLLPIDRSGCLFSVALFRRVTPPGR